NGIKRAQSPSRKAQGDRDFKATPQEWSEERYSATQRQLYMVMYISESGAVSAEYGYDPFGKVIAHTGMEFDFQFSTKFYDPDIGMYYYGYRYYSPELRRWASRDPAWEELFDMEPNPYAFIRNDPAAKIDFLGLWLFEYILGQVRQEILYKIIQEISVHVRKKSDSHYQKLTEKLKSSLTTMCPKVETEWIKKGRSKCVVCKPETCRREAEVFAKHYVSKLKEIYTRSKVPGGWSGNLIISITGMDNTNPYETDFLGFVCDDWQTMAANIFEETLKDSNCWVYIAGNQEFLDPSNPLRKWFDINPSHAWGVLRSVTGQRLTLDPWKSGGWDYGNEQKSEKWDLK
ncbi:MAG: hypothetical protein J6334_11405, partial [Kiritimatiellae bacterium]|nr:hypothetical protein [Kiritimatiellia bacterium]